MLATEFTRAKELAQKLGHSPIFAPDDWNGFGLRSLVDGLDLTCRTLYVVTEHDLPEKWENVPESAREGIATAYKELARASAPLRKHEFDMRHPRLHGDVLAMAEQSGEAQYALSCLTALSAEELTTTTKEKDLTTMAEAALGAVVAWRPYVACFEGEHERYYEANLSSGINLLDHTLLPAVTWVAEL